MRFLLSSSIVFPLVLLLVAVASPVTSNAVTDWELTPQPHILESPSPTDSKDIETVWSLFKESFYEATETSFSLPSKIADLRQAHVKQYGCGMASLKVMDNVPPHLSEGIFSTPGTFDVMFRFSAGGGNGFVRGLHGARKEFFHLDDMEKDNRALALKVFGVKGTPTGTADFTFTTNQCPFARSSDEGVEYFKAVNSNSTLDYLGMVGTHPHLALLLYDTVKSGEVSSLVHVPYFASAPHAMGETQAVRMRLRPSINNYMPEHAKDGDPHKLTHLLSSTLSHGPGSAVFFWEVQQYSNSNETPIEDATILWKNQPWLTVATVTLTSDHIDLDRDERLCRPTTFNPVNVPSANRGIGGAQRMRRVVYTKLQEMRIPTEARLGADISHLDSSTGQPDLEWVKQTWGPMAGRHRNVARTDSINMEQPSSSSPKKASVSIDIEVDVK